MIKSKIKEFSKRYKKDVGFILILGSGLLLAGVLANGFLELLEELSQKQLAPFDDAVAGYVETLRSKPLTKFFRTASMFGDQELYFIAIPVLAVIIYLVFKKIRIALRLTVALIVASLINLLLKEFIERPRPQGEHMVEVSTYSFPSGHTVSSVVFYGFLIYIFWRSDIKTSFKVILTILLSLVILSIGLSRIYLGVHYTTDVIAGYLAGAFFLMIFILAFYITDFIKNNHRAGIKSEK